MTAGLDATFSIEARDIQSNRVFAPSSFLSRLRSSNEESSPSFGKATVVKKGTTKVNISTTSTAADLLDVSMLRGEELEVARNYY